MSLLDDESLTSTTLKNNHVFIIKVMRTYVQSRQYQTIVKSRVHLTIITQAKLYVIEHINNVLIKTRWMNI